MRAAPYVLSQQFPVELISRLLPFQLPFQLFTVLRLFIISLSSHLQPTLILVSPSLVSLQLIMLSFLLRILIVLAQEQFQILWQKSLSVTEFLFVQQSHLVFNRLEFQYCHFFEVNLLFIFMGLEMVQCFKNQVQFMVLLILAINLLIL